jgi:hypothetical protein
MTAHDRPYATIDDRVAEKTRDLHKRYPKLGHHGLGDALRQSGIHVEADELERFMEEHKMRSEKPWRPWRWRGLPAWMGGRGGRADDD